MRSFHWFYQGVIAPLTVFIPLYYAFVNYHFFKLPQKILLWLLILSGVINAICTTLAYFYIPNLVFFHIFSIVEFDLLSIFYMLVFDRKWYKVFIPVITIFTVLGVINMVFIQNGSQFNSYTNSVSSIIIIIYSLLFLTKQNNTDVEVSWGTNSLNWINTGILVYHASNLFIFLFSNHLLKVDPGLVSKVWMIHDTILILEYVLFAIGFKRCKN
jgi:hypothetical protein